MSGVQFKLNIHSERTRRIGKNIKMIERFFFVVASYLVVFVAYIWEHET